MPRMLEAEYELFNRRRAEFEEEHDREWVVICGEEVAGSFTDLEEAALAATDRSGPEGPYLIELDRGREAPATAVPVPETDVRLS